MMADHLIVSTPVIKERMQAVTGFDDSKMTIIPNGWDNKNPLWNKPIRDPRRISVGWGGTITHRQDFELILKPVEAFFNSQPSAHLFIAGDPAIYKKFFRLPENRKTFVPMLPYTYYPHFLNGLDILLVPLIDDHFNRAKSDIKLVEAGASSLAYVASSVEQYRKWHEGGFLATNENEWFGAMQMLIDRDVNKLYADRGHKKANKRKLSVLAKQWVAAIESVL
jgi:hypothetical protein